MSNLINQDAFFDGLDFEKCVFNIATNKKTCFKVQDGGYYSVDHFKGYYVIEFAKDYEDAKRNIFEDDDIFEDTLPEDDIIKQIRETLISYVSPSDG